MDPSELSHMDFCTTSVAA